MGTDYLQARMDMVARQLHRRGILDARVLAAFEVWNVFVHAGDGSLGWAESAPYEAILVSAAAADVPQALLEQLTDPGRMILPVGGRGGQHLELWRRSAGAFSCESLLPVAFVPLRGGVGL